MVDKLRRFVVFVCHPEAMIYGEPKILGRRQDLSLEAAAKLAKISIHESFYERVLRLRDHKPLHGEDRIRRNNFNRTTIAEIESVADQHAIPEATERQKRNTTPFAERRRLHQYPDLYRFFSKIEGAGHGKLATLDEELSNFMSTNQFELASSRYSFIHNQAKAIRLARCRISSYSLRSILILLHPGG